MGKLFIVRHGETDFNAQNRFTGGTDIELNEKGLSQAEQVAEKLKAYPVDVLISSPLKRALQTANAIQARIKKPIVVMKEFAERSIGIYEGLTRDEVKVKYPELWGMSLTREMDKVPDGGETIRQVRERVRKGLDYIRSMYKEQNVILVAHGYVAREIYGYFNNTEDEAFYSYVFGNCQVAEYELG